MPTSSKGNVDATGTSIIMFFVAAVVIFTAVCICLPPFMVYLSKEDVLSTVVNIFPWLPALTSNRTYLFAANLLVLVFGWYHIMSVTEEQHKMGMKSDLRYINYLKSQNHLLWFLTLLFILSLFMAYGFVPMMNRINTI